MNYSQPRGISLMEVMVATGMLAVTATAVVMATTGSMRNTRLADETRAVAFAARKELEKYLSPVTDITSVKTQIAANNTFKVYVNDVDGAGITKIELPGIRGFDAGEVILVDNEQVTPAQLGRDLTGDSDGSDDGNPDGVSLSPLPMDFNGNNTTNDANNVAFQKSACKALIGVVIRWTSTNGLEQRYELWSVR